MPITRRILPKNAPEVRDQLKDMRVRAEQQSMSRGSRGDAVADLQKRLRSFGVYTGKADGVFTAKTDRAVRAFQRQAGIIVDGVAGPQKVAALRRNTLFVQDGFEGSPGKVGQRGSDIRAAEVMLRDLGMNPGQVDGKLDKNTAAAVGRFTERDPQLSTRQTINAETFDRLKVRSARSLEVGANTAGVRQLEKNLVRLGFKPGAVNREYTAETKSAVRAFQRKGGLDRTGIADPATRKAIQKAVDDLPPPLAEKLARFGRTPPKADYRRRVVNSDGDRLNQRTIQLMRRAETIMREKYGHNGFSFSVVQGSYSGSVSASGGTHDQGGAIDIHTRSYGKSTVDDMVRSLRQAGFAAWSRGRGHDSFDPHIHAIAIGDRELSSSAANQVQEYFNGGDGLVGSAPDPDGNLGRPVPKWAKRFNR